MGYAHKILPSYTYNEYCQWEGKWELIEGFAYAMSPAPKPKHQAVAGNLHAELRAALKAASCKCKVYQPLDYKIAEDTVLQPDLLVVCKPIVKPYLDFAPQLVVEILSPATALKDRHTKYEIYRQQGIPYYILIEPDAETVEVFTLSADGVYQNHLFTQANQCHFSWEDCAFDFDFNTIWS